MLVLFIYQLISIIINYYKVKKYAGNRIESFDHKTFKKISIIFIVGGSILNLIFLSLSADFTLLDFALFQLYLLADFFKSTKKINVYENGILHQGKFIKWEQIKSIKEADKERINIELKSYFRVISVEGVERKLEFLNKLNNNCM